MSGDGDFRFSGYHPVISCEGTAEKVAVDILLEADALVFPKADVVDVTRLRKASDIQDKYLNLDYDWPLCVVRVLDSRKERFKLGNLYAGRFPVVSYVTHPEIEVLAIIREGAWRRWHGGRMKPSDFCKQELGMREVKREKASLEVIGMPIRLRPPPGTTGAFRKSQRASCAWRTSFGKGLQLP